MTSSPRLSVEEAAAEAAEFGPLLEALAERVPERMDVVAALAVAAFRRAPDQGMRHLRADVEVAAARLADAFAFLDRRRPGALALRVFNPTASEHGWSVPASVVEVNTEDGPFLLSTITEELGRLGLEPMEVLHPVVGVERGDDGQVLALRPARRSDNRESFIHIVLSERLDDERREEVATNLRRVLNDARAATRDFQAMKERIRSVMDETRHTAGRRYDDEEVAEAAQLLGWLLDDHFVFLGYRAYELIDVGGEPAAHTVPGSGLGLLADEQTSTYADPVPLSEVPSELRARMTGGDLLTVSRTNRTSTVHRRARMIYIGVKRIGDDGSITGEYRVIGLFAQKAYAEPASTIPVLRRKLRQVLEREDVVEHSHDERALRTLFDAFPKTELFAADTNALRRTLVSLLDTQERRRVRLLCRVDPGQRGVSALVSLPRERFNASIRQRVQRLLVERFGATAVDYHLSLTERDEALLHFLLHVDPQAVGDVSVERLEQEVIAVTRTWQDELGDALGEQHGALEGKRLADEWAGRLPPGYESTTDPVTAVADLTVLEQMRAPHVEVRMALREEAGRAVPLRFKLYRRGGGVELSSFVPILESLGFVVVEEVPHDIALPPGPGSGTVHLHDFGIRLDMQHILDIDADGDRVAAAALGMWEGAAEPDSLNRLVLRAGLDWEDVAILRAYRRYRRQVGTSFTEAYQNEALIEHAGVARALMALFRARLDPEADGSPEAIERARAAVREGLDAVQRLDQDRILRRYFGVIEATVRTNRYVRRSGQRGSPALAFKIDSAQVPEVPKPVPYTEIFVYSPTLEGVHLRGGPVARGGIRWSDRQEDVRTEVLGLMKAQMVKNAVIVPTGSKGGFVLKRPPADATALRDEVRRQYEIYIRALLDVTDNVVAGAVRAPADVRRRDGDDPYLVVAADRGTATFSDVANAISEAYGFWLQDAFASGGSRGYDHKEMGITARGAWVAVQRHFRELGIDVQTEPVDVVGIGDMSGDVFGNGLLRSRAVRLIAAFDHRDIFVDPDPDAETAYHERQRLFEKPGSSWQDYDPTRISHGGGVWSRAVKEIRLSPEARAALRVDAEVVTPPELIQAILRAPVDLLFAGGIGTFVKASDEANADVGDRANDAVRIDATEVGARVVGEGGNLAFTQRARIQYARRGGRCNTDAIDNAAGVATSDREVNLKILLRMAEEEQRIVRPERDKLLEDMTDEVASAVLRDIYLQTWALSQEVAGSPGGMEAYERLMVDLEEGATGDEPRRLERTVEVLPARAEMEQRRQAGAGLTRPELAVLLGYAKVDLRERLLRSEVLGQQRLVDALEGYFPTHAVERFPDLLERHRLRRELIATIVANDLVNRLGITYVSRTAHEFGAMAADVAAAYWAAREVCNADGHWRMVEALDDRTDPALQLELKAEVDRLVDACVRSYLRQGVTDVGLIVELDGPAFTELEAVVGDIGPPGRQRMRTSRAMHYLDLGIDREVAERLTLLGELAIVPDVAGVAREAGATVRHVADLFFHISEALPLDQLNGCLQQVEPVGHWERWQHRGLVDELRRVRRETALRILSEAGPQPAAEAVERFLAARPAGRERMATMLRMLEDDPGPGLAAVAVAVRTVHDALVS